MNSTRKHKSCGRLLEPEKPIAINGGHLLLLHIIDNTITELEKTIIFHRFRPLCEAIGR